ncbi:MAG: MoaD/ThiS family protein [Actinobacteria bacterium]|nr:MoaD/ThiS family protein [Actinomycetota bacterium]
MAVVLLPGLLATQAGGKNRFEVDASSVAEALRALPISDLIFDEAGGLRGLVNVYVDGKDMRTREGLDTPLAGEEEIRIVAAIAGGSCSSS